MTFGDWLKNNGHWVGLFGIVFGFLSGLYFYAQSKQVGEISLRFNTVKVIDAGIRSIKILDNDNNQITSSVFGCEIVLWNSGSLSLGEKSDRIREPVTVLLPKIRRIIDATVQEARNVPANGIKVEHQNNSVSIRWSDFDPGDAIKIFVLYAADTQSPIEYRARFVETKLNDVSNWREAYPGLGGLAGAYTNIRYDLEHHRIATAAALLGMLAQLAGLLLFFVPRVRRSVRGRNTIIGLLVASLPIYILSLIMNAYYTYTVPL